MRLRGLPGLIYYLVFKERLPVTRNRIVHIEVIDLRTVIGCKGDQVLHAALINGYVRGQQRFEKPLVPSLRRGFFVVQSFVIA